MNRSAILWQRTQRITLSVPTQAAMMTSLCGLILWMLFFSAYPPVHNALHSIRHNTAGVGCH